MQQKLSGNIGTLGMRYEDVDELNEEIHKIDRFDTEFGIEHGINNSKKTKEVRKRGWCKTCDEQG